MAIIKDCKCIKNEGGKEMDVCCQMKFNNNQNCTISATMRICENKNVVYPKTH